MKVDTSTIADVPILRRVLWGAKGRLLGYDRACPVCARPVRAFLPLLGQGSDWEADLRRCGFDLRLLERMETLHLAEYSCPRCGATDRDRLIVLELAELVRKGPGIVRFLDIAPSKPLRAFLQGSTRVAYRSADLLRSDVDDPGLDVQRMDRYPDARFEAILCSHVLEHVPDDHRAMRELHRVLAPGGWAIVMAPILLSLSETDEDPTLADEAERVRRFSQRDHVRLYARTDFVARLRSAGFEVEEKQARCFGPERLRRCGIAPGSVLYIAHKRAA